MVRHAVHSSHQFFGEVTNQITNIKSPIFLFQVIKMCCMIQLCLRVRNVYRNWIIAHFGDLKQKNRWFEIGDLVGDFTKKLVTRMDGAPKFLAAFKKKLSILFVFDFVPWMWRWKLSLTYAARKLREFPYFPTNFHDLKRYFEVQMLFILVQSNVALKSKGKRQLYPCQCSFVLGSLATVPVQYTYKLNEIQRTLAIHRITSSFFLQRWLVKSPSVETYYKSLMS